MLPPHFCVPVAVVKKQQVEGGEGGVRDTQAHRRREGREREKQAQTRTTGTNWVKVGRRGVRSNTSIVAEICSLQQELP